LVLEPAERSQLERWPRLPRTEQRLAIRSRIVLRSADGVDNDEVAAELGVSDKTVAKWRRRFVERRLTGLSDEPRAGCRDGFGRQGEGDRAPDDREQPVEATHWSTRSMAARVGVSAATVGRIWQAFGLKPRWSRRSRSGLSDFLCKRGLSLSGCRRRGVAQTALRLAGRTTIPDRRVSLVDADARPIRRGNPRAHRVWLQGAGHRHQRGLRHRRGAERANPPDDTLLDGAIAKAKASGMQVRSVYADRGFGTSSAELLSPATASQTP
jgi:hypothetical protein